MIPVLKAAGIDVHSKYTAIESISASNMGVTGYRALILEIMQGNVNIDIADHEVKHTLMYLTNQIFSDDDRDINLEEAHQKAKDLIAKLPQVLLLDTSLDETKVNADGVAVGKTGKPRKGYKKEMAIRLYRERQDDGLTKKEWVDLFVKEISDLSRPVAHSYLHHLQHGKW